MPFFFARIPPSSLLSSFTPFSSLLLSSSAPAPLSLHFLCPFCLVRSALALGEGTVFVDVTIDENNDKESNT